MIYNLARPIYAAHHVIILPHSYARILVKSPSLLADRDYIFESRNPQVSLYAHVTDNDFPFVQALNQTSRPVTIAWRARLGHLADYDAIEAYHLDALAADLARTDPPKPLVDSAIRPESNLEKEYIQLWVEN